jgi:hypothetical protein
MSVTKLSLAGKNVSLVSDVPAGDEKIDHLFYSVVALQCIADAMIPVIWTGMVIFTF